MITKQKNLSYKIPREIVSVKNWTQHLPFGPFKLNFFLNQAFKNLGYTNSYNKYNKILLN